MRLKMRLKKWEKWEKSPGIFGYFPRHYFRLFQAGLRDKRQAQREKRGEKRDEEKPGFCLKMVRSVGHMLVHMIGFYSILML